ncbi:RNA-binding protein [Brevundimonas nasdae]|uniref:RNA-binding protein n=1 Tax=Brevundimonas nasdae TaxID=172043 RepID=A0A0B4C5T9_9CAUL|nr:ribonuclease E/G [Brevundimonas nasdae]KIC56399.1 RNA-binding protein [Brevundimonas nasdae]
MSDAVEVFLDETPGETRGAIMRDGHYTHLLIHREDDAAQTRLGARSVGRVIEVNPGLRGAFVDIAAPTAAFLPFPKNDRITQGQRMEVVVTAEPRAGKGAVVRRLGVGEGTPRLIQPAPSIAEQLRDLAPGEESITGIAAIDAVIEAEEEALAQSISFTSHGIDLAVERTRALVAVDIDFTSTPGRDPKQARAVANREGLKQAARLIGLRNWGGLVVIDMVGDGQDAEAQSKVARAAFDHEPQAVFGPVSRFGLLQMSLPWRRTPIEDLLLDAGRRPSVQTRAISVVRALRRQLLVDTLSPRITARCSPDEALIAHPLAARLGPRAVIQADAAIPPGRGRIEEG